MSLLNNQVHFLGYYFNGLSSGLSGSLSADDPATKFHGIYQQDNRDRRAERRRKKLDKAYTFMARICLGVYAHLTSGLP